MCRKKDNHGQQQHDAAGPGKACHKYSCKSTCTIARKTVCSCERPPPPPKPPPPEPHRSRPSKSTAKYTRQRAINNPTNPHTSPPLQTTICDCESSPPSLAPPLPKPRCPRSGTARQYTIQREHNNLLDVPSLQTQQPSTLLPPPGTPSCVTLCTHNSQSATTSVNYILGIDSIYKQRPLLQ